MGGSAPLQAAALTPKGLLIRRAVLGLMLNRSATLRTLLHLSIRVSNSGAIRGLPRRLPSTLAGRRRGFESLLVQKKIDARSVDLREEDYQVLQAAA
jgi:hypothetical protein